MTISIPIWARLTGEPRHFPVLKAPITETTATLVCQAFCGGGTVSQWFSPVGPHEAVHNPQILSQCELRSFRICLNFAASVPPRFEKTDAPTAQGSTLSPWFHGSPLGTTTDVAFISLSRFSRRPNLEITSRDH